MEFMPQEHHIHIGKDPLVEPYHFASVPVNTISPFTKGISTPPHHDNMEYNPQEHHIHLDEVAPSAPQDTISPPADTTEYPTGPQGGIGNWIWKDDKEKTILGPYEYVASQPGKELRTLLLSKFNAWLQVPEQSFNIIAGVVRMLHTASLLIDDIQDNSQLRRGKPVAHRIYGIAQTINAANYVYFQALQELYKLNNPARAIEVYTEELVHLHRGQGMDLWWRDTLTCPTEEEYLEMASNKTGGLFRLAIRLMQVESPTSIDCVPLVELVGLIFQIVDDHKNLSDIDYTAKKGVCEDLTEGKFSFPIIHSIRADSKNSQLLHILAQRPTDLEVKRTAVQYIKSTNSFEYTEQYVERLTIQARDVADNLGEGIGGSAGIHTLLDLISSLISRSGDERRQVMGNGT
nr:SonG [Paraconiothyrium archidendri]